MYDTKARVELVKDGVRRLRRRRKKHILCGLSALCIMLSAALVTAMGTFAGFGHPTVCAFYGTILLHENAGGYVLVGLVAFCAAVVITALCFKYRELQRRKELDGANSDGNNR